MAQQRKLLFLNLFIFISGNLYFLLRAMGSSKIWRCRVSDVCTYPRLRHVIGVNAMDSRICCLLPLYPTRQPKRRKNKEIFYTYLYWQPTYFSCNNVQNYRLYLYVFFFFQRIIKGITPDIKSARVNAPSKAQMKPNFSGSYWIIHQCM